LPLLFASLGLLVAARVSGLVPGVALKFWGDPIVLGFLLGAVVGIIFNKGVRLSIPSTVALAAIGFGVLFFSGAPTGAEDALWPRLAKAIPSTLILIALALGPQVDEKRGLWRPGLLVGDASYSLYLVHAFLLRLLSLAWFKGPLATLSLWAYIPIGFTIVVPFAIFTYWCFERPVTRWLNGKEAPGTILAVDRFVRRILSQGRDAAPAGSR